MTEQIIVAWVSPKAFWWAAPASATDQCRPSCSAGPRPRQAFAEVIRKDLFGWFYHSTALELVRPWTWPPLLPLVSLLERQFRFSDTTRQMQQTYHKRHKMDHHLVGTSTGSIVFGQNDKHWMSSIRVDNSIDLHCTVDMLLPWDDIPSAGCCQWSWWCCLVRH